MPEQFHIAFYRFVRIADPTQIADALRDLTRGLCGTLLVAGEGINAMLAGESAMLDRFEHALRADRRMQGLFQGITCQRSPCRTAPFQRMKVHVRAEILPLGISGVDAVGRRGTQLDARRWQDLLTEGRAVVIDNRNSFEFRLGRFRGAIDPGVGNFRDLPDFIGAHAPVWKAEGRPVAMYCTGGIRCEKTAAWMADAFAIDVLQLEGGILRYLAEATRAVSPGSVDGIEAGPVGAGKRQEGEPGGGPGHGYDDRLAAWQGECFVFDNRIALDARLQETATTAADVYAGDPDEAWRLERAQRLAAAAG